jgi:hypothetical protein
MYPTGIGERLDAWAAQQPSFDPLGSFGVDGLTWSCYVREIFVPSSRVRESIAAAGGPPVLAWEPLRAALDATCSACGSSAVSCGCFARRSA